MTVQQVVPSSHLNGDCSAVTLDSALTVAHAPNACVAKHLSLTLCTSHLFFAVGGVKPVGCKKALLSADAYVSAGGVVIVLNLKGSFQQSGPLPALRSVCACG